MQFQSLACAGWWFADGDENRYWTMAKNSQWRLIHWHRCGRCTPSTCVTTQLQFSCSQSCQQHTTTPPAYLVTCHRHTWWLVTGTPGDLLPVHLVTCYQCTRWLLLTHLVIHHRHTWWLLLTHLVTCYVTCEVFAAAQSDERSREETLPSLAVWCADQLRMDTVERDTSHSSAVHDASCVNSARRCVAPTPAAGSDSPCDTLAATPVRSVLHTQPPTYNIHSCWFNNTVSLQVSHISSAQHKLRELTSATHHVNSLPTFVIWLWCLFVQSVFNVFST